MKKHLKLAVLTENAKEVRFQIAEQSHRVDAFGENGSLEFGMLVSAQYPEICLDADGELGELLVRGEDTLLDDEIITTTPEIFKIIEQEVFEYNEFEFEGIEPEILPVETVVRYVG